MKYFLAGHFDGEGCLMWNNTPTVSVSHTFLPVLRIYSYLFGGIPKRKDEDNFKSCWQWRIYGDNARFFIDTLKPFMLEKREQARLLMEIDRTDSKDPERAILMEDLKLLKKGEVRE